MNDKYIKGNSVILLVKKMKLTRMSINITDHEFMHWLKARMTFADGNIENGLKRLLNYKRQ